MKRMLGRLLLISAVAPLVLSGCLWGVVRDSRTGHPLEGAQVAFRDAAGASATAITDADGIFTFRGGETALPAAGPVTFEVSAVAYQTLSTEREVRYDDDASGMTEAQSFKLTPSDLPAVPPSGG